MKSRGLKGLANRYRPELFSEFLGHEKMVKGIQEKWESDKRPTAYLFSGDTGCGKTTIARIIEVSANCGHQEIFGEPCLRCRKNRHQFDILEINASETTGWEGIRDVTKSYLYEPTPPSRMRVFVLDEAQRLSDAAQNYLLKPFEDGPATTLWIICTTNPQKILPTLRGRCSQWRMARFGTKNTEHLVREVIKLERASGNCLEEIPEKKIEKFVENLIQARIQTPRNILNQLERFLTEKDPTCPLQTETMDADLRLGRLVWEGNWKAVREGVKNLTDSELNALRYALLSYFRAILVKEGRGRMAEKIVETMEDLTQAGSFDEQLTGYKMLALLYRLCDRFRPKGRT